MEKFSGWFRIILTWVVIIPDLIVSYVALRNPFYTTEMMSLALNFVAATVLFYIYIDMNVESEEEGDEEEPSRRREEEPSSDKKTCALYKLAFGSLIEDMLVWAGLFCLLYNIVPVTLFIHNIIGKAL